VTDTTQEQQHRRNEEAGQRRNPASAPIERRKMTPAPDTAESVARERMK